MAMGRQRRAAENPFYRALNELLGENGFDRFAEDLCEEFYAGNVGRPGAARQPRRLRHDEPTVD